MSEHRESTPHGQYIGSVREDSEGLVRLRTLITIRWVAVAGQLAALIAVHFGLGWALPMNAALAVIAASALFNVAMNFRRPERGRLKEGEAAGYLAFDTLQLAALLYLTGGLTNPFALLFLGPVTVSATILTRRATVVLCALVVACATILVFFHRPLPWSAAGLELPEIYVWGLWTAVIVGTLFLAAYARSVAEEGRRMSNALAAAQLALAREQQLSAVGGLAAAAAHELGSPLSTIVVTAKELRNEVPADSPYADDIRILQAEAERCREILSDLGREPTEQDMGGPFARPSLSALVRAAAERHQDDAVELTIIADSDDGTAEPVVANRPEFIHGLGNIVQNAMQFAETKVDVHAYWSEEEVRIRVCDDGRGFAPALLDRLGEPYISSRGQGHLGLGIFIAQSLLERTGARLAFANQREAGGRAAGAEVTITWPRASLDVGGRAG